MKATVPATGATEHAAEAKSTRTSIPMHEREAEMERNCHTLEAQSSSTIPKNIFGRGKASTKLGE